LLFIIVRLLFINICEICL